MGADKDVLGLKVSAPNHAEQSPRYTSLHILNIYIIRLQNSEKCTSVYVELGLPVLY